MTKNIQEKDLFNNNTLVIYRMLLFFSILESFVVVGIILIESIERIGQLFDSSTICFVFAFLIITFLFLGFLLFESFVARNIITKIYRKVSQVTSNTFFGLLLIITILIGLLLELLILIPATEYYQIIVKSIYSYKAFSAILILVILLGVQVLGFFIILRKPNWKNLVTDSGLRNMAFGHIILGVTLLYWEILFIQSPILMSIPHWFRPLMKQPFTLQHFYYLPFLLLILWGVKLVFSESISTGKGMIMLIFFGYCFQVMFGLVAGEGFESIRKSYADRPISHTVYYGCGDMSITESIRNYEGHYANSYRVQTKPPGYLVGHKIFAKVTNFLSHSQSIDDCIYNYTRIGAYIFPLLASLVIIPITYLSKSLFNLKYPLLPSLIYILTPNFMIWVMVVDQVFFPMIFLINVVLMYLTIKNDSFFMAIGLGIVVYFSSFISFAMLPIIGLYFLWLAFGYLANKNEKKIITIFKLFIGFSLGFGLTYFVFYVSLNYDAILRYQMATYHHRQIKNYSFNLHTIRNAFIINSAEYFSWTGYHCSF